MNSTIFNGESTKIYSVINLNVKTFIDIGEKIVEKNELAGGYMVRHSKLKGVSYNSEDEYVDQFITLYVPPKKNKCNKKDAIKSSANDENEVANEASNEENSDIPKEDIHEFSFDTKYILNDANEILYICDPGVGNRTTLNSILNILYKVRDDCGNYFIKYRNDNLIYDINEIHVNTSMKSIKFY